MEHLRHENETLKLGKKGQNLKMKASNVEPAFLNQYKTTSASQLKMVSVVRLEDLNKYRSHQHLRPVSNMNKKVERVCASAEVLSKKPQQEGLSKKGIFSRLLSKLARRKASRT